MSSHTRKVSKSRRQGKNLISTNKIKPEKWNISPAEAKEALQAKGYDVKEVKKISCLKHQVCISFWDNQGNICSSFFSYRIFARWQQDVEKLIYNCENVKAWKKINYILGYEFDYYQYPHEIEEALKTALENRLCVLKITEQQAVF
ncbi:MAG TPA: hypothetical protein VK203_04700 [Nostocaceae cyanobacterium]|nr:hypothetical protein [Nostocaceae cyanobacterium]